ncbi:MAG: type I-F CRISPR-associated helicase Cas3f [Methylococcales bacterium]|nr:type I-F CRISPR-associated helicase Cas3f [Methylococcales bacterium]
MMVTFVSQCEHKALNRTRRVLDAFANRIGSRTWQTVITEEGLQAVKKLLRHTATKNTAVSCHWIRSRSRSDLLWVVGNRSKFNAQGIVPVNFTEAEISQFMDNSQWQTIEIIKYASAIAGLFHDFGKANELFQQKLNSNYHGLRYEPYRHEWVSLRLFQAFVGDDKNDEQWLIALSQIESNEFSNYFKDGLDGEVKNNHPLEKLPPFAKLIAWLILSHHKLPLFPDWKEFENKPPKPALTLEYVDKWITKNEFNAIWNSHNCKDQDQKALIEKNWEFKSLPVASMQWRSKACLLSSEAKAKLPLVLKQQDTDWLNNQLFTTHFSRLCLILADHYYSSLDEVTEEWRNPNYEVYANTYGRSHAKAGQFKQKLDEHLIGVAHHAQKIAKALPKLNASLKPLKGNSALTGNVKKEYKDDFGWQDDAKKLAKEIGKTTLEHGFFGINMASTGKGKTLANAKIMYALGSAAGRIRFSVALGLRTLTLQTGLAYRNELKLSNKDLAIAVGGDAVKQLFEQKNQFSIQPEQTETGSASQEEFLDADLYVDYAADTYEHSLSSWTKNNIQLNKLIHAPVLVCTIDHLMPATEATKGGKHIPAMLRLLTSDLILDEPDDFGLEDLPALCRLVHWTGLSGSRVLLSTATMPPALVYALFQAYQQGWAEYAKANINNWNGEIACAWFDEFDKNHQPEQHKDFNTFKASHEKFIQSRIKSINTHSKPQRKAIVINIEQHKGETVIFNIAKVIHTHIEKLHKEHYQTQNNKNISVGLVRMANINPLVTVAKTLLKLDAPEDTCIHYCVYHSRYPLAVRSYLENKLDKILNRKNINDIWQHNEIAEKLQKYPQNNHIFVIIASPVAEVGRDHDYDWAIVEPSSMRSIIQLAGRVLRHRKDIPETPNILLLNKNYKALKNKKPCFEKPGFESRQLKPIASYDLNEILNKEQYEEINSIQRIIEPKKNTERTYSNLVELEHEALNFKLFSNNDGAKIWWKNHPHWCGEVQRQQRFRQSKKDEAYYLCLKDENSNTYWQWKNENVSPPKFGELVGITINNNIEIELGKNSFFWFNLNAEKIYSALAKDFHDDLLTISHRFGEVRLVEYDDNKIEQYNYHENLGLYQEIGNKDDNQY